MSELTDIILPDGTPYIPTNATKVNYNIYQNMSTAEKNDGRIRFCDDWPDDSGRTYYDETNKMICFAAGIGYDSNTKTIIF